MFVWGVGGEQAKAKTRMNISLTFIRWTQTCSWLLDPNYDFEYIHKYWKSYCGDNNFMEHKVSNLSVGISSKSHFRIVFTSRILPRQPELIFIHSTINMKSITKSGTIHLHYIRDWLHWYLLKCRPQCISKPIYLSKATSHYGASSVHPPEQVRVLSGLAGRSVKLSILSDCLLPRLVFISTPSLASQTW